MWRSEERLAFWLTGGSPPARPKRSTWIGRLRLRQLPVVINDLPLNIDGETASLDEALSAEANVKDGLGTLFETSSENDSPNGSGYWTSVPVGSIGPLDTAVVRRISMPNAHRTRVRQEMLVIVPKSRSATTEIESHIHMVESLEDRPVRVQDYPLLLSHPAIHATAKISELPHRRASTEVVGLEDSERKSFLREAEVLKRIPSDRAELLAVFRHVPIEMISRLRFLADSREILYAIQEEPKKTQTRLHDLAVIRDAGNQEIHLVPHRTKSRSILLT
jgi:hypothetical protein